MDDRELLEEVSRLCAETGLDPKNCGRNTLIRQLGLSEHRARRAARLLRQTAPRAATPPCPPPTPKTPPRQTESHERTRDTWTIDLPKTNLRTLDDVVQHCEIDLEVWEVERWVCNKWEVGMKPPATTVMVPRLEDGAPVPMWTRTDDEVVVQPLFQIKVWLVLREAKRLQGPDSKLEFLRQLREIVEQDDFEFAAKPVRLPKPVQPDTPEIAVVCVSDWHLSETVRPEDANGVNFYNSIVAANRLWEQIQKTKAIVSRHAGMCRIEKIWSPVLGDMVNGTIHPEYVASNDLSDVAAVVLGSRLLRMFYEELRSLGLPIEIDAVHGNHARQTAKVPTKRQAQSNYDWALYQILLESLKNDEQISMSIATSQIGTRKLFDWNYVFEHGIDVRNGKEEDFEDRVRALFDDPTFREATGYQGSAFDQILIGNMHKPKWLERTIVSGSLIGQNELGQSWRLKPIRAQQLVWGISREQPRTWQYNVDLTHVKTDAVMNPFSEYAKWFVERNGQ